MSFPPRVVSPRRSPSLPGYVERGIISPTRLWPPRDGGGVTLRVRFMGGAEDQRALVMRCAREWTVGAAIDLVRSEAYDAEIRVCFGSGDGDWSYIGTDSLPPIVGYMEPSMNLSRIEPAVVRHEFGHALGLDHEHQRPDRPLVFDEEQVEAEFSRPPNRWTLDEIRENILAPLSRERVATTPFDRNSVMIYEVPRRWLKSGEPIPRNETLSAGDLSTIAQAYGTRR